MFFDAMLVLAGSYSTSTGAWTGQSPLTASVAAGNTIDLKPDGNASPARHIGDSGITFLIWATTTVTTGQTLTVDFLTSTDTTITTADQLIASSGPIATAGLAAGSNPIAVVLPSLPKTANRYLGAYFTEGGTILAGAVVVAGQLNTQTNGL